MVNDLLTSPLIDLALPAELRLAVAHTPLAHREALTALLTFDAMLGRVVEQAREPLLAQVRLAWWRDRLREAEPDAPAKDPLLRSLRVAWRGEEAALSTLVDRWEEVLGEDCLNLTALDGLASARAECLARFAAIAGLSRDVAVERAGRRWALADLAFRSENAETREHMLDLAGSVAPTGRLARPLRGIAVLDALARRAVARREPIMSGRVAPLVALRVGMTGR